MAGVVHHAVETDAYTFREAPEDYLLFLGRFTEGKGVLAAIDVARRSGHRLLLAAAENDYYREQVAPLVDGRQVVYTGEVPQGEKVALLGGARALVYPVQAGESFGLVLAEAAACGTPVAALRCGAVSEIVEDDVTGMVFDSVDDLVTGLPRVLALDRRAIRARAVTRFGVDRMVEGHLALYAALIGAAADRPEDGSDATCGPLPARGLRSSRRRIAGQRRAAGPVRRRGDPHVAAVLQPRGARRAWTMPTGCTWASPAPGSSRRRPASWGSPT